FAAIFGAIYAFEHWVWPPAVLVLYEGKEGKLLISRRYERGPARKEREGYDLRDLIAIRAVREQERPDSKSTVWLIPRSLVLLLQGLHEPVSQSVNVSLEPIKISEFSILRGAPSSWRMLRASFQEIWQAIRRCL